jgi:hypothetical protein
MSSPSAFRAVGDEVAGAIDRRTLPGRDHRRGVELFDDGRTRHDRARAQLVTLHARARFPAGAGQEHATP